MESNCLHENAEYWDRLYDTQHVVSHVFRPFGRIIAKDFGLTGARHERVLDYGCASGSAVLFYKEKGFDAYGVDISRDNIGACRRRMPDIADHFAVIDAMPKEKDLYFGGEFDLILAIDSLYYYTDELLHLRLQTLRRQLKPGGIIYATMLGSGSTAYTDHSTRLENGMYKVNFLRWGQRTFHQYHAFGG
jgi:SAM-dependent methyltransferase